MARDQRAYSASRRTFCWTFAGVLVAPSIAVAQTSAAVRRIGELASGAPASPEFIWKQAEPLRARGWVEGQNLHVERRFDSGQPEQLQAFAEELVRSKVELIVTNGTGPTLAAKRATNTIPIVFDSAGDPVLLGLVASLARPGGNVTGYSVVSQEMAAKQLSLLKELLPRLQRVGMMWEAGHPYYRVARGQFEHVCKSLGLVPIIVEIGATGEIGDAIAQLARQHAQALVLQPSPFTNNHRAEIIDAATKHGLPTMTHEAEGGALITYSTTDAEQAQVRADYIDRILRGAKPADLPVQQPTKFELVINLKTAKALGLTIPQSLLLRADEVIQ
jgi:putative ABC transport system substrate-binding protein